MKKLLIFALLSLACDPQVQPDEFRVGCDGTTGVIEPPTPTVGIPTPTAPCPAIVDGNVTFCPEALLSCRTAVVVNAANAADGPLALYWHGTGETPENVLAWDSAGVAIRAMVQAEDGLMVLPRADPAANSRASNPFPWWVVCGETNPSQCTRPDDFILADEIVACAVEQGLVDTTRLTTAGFSAGGIMASHMVDRVDYLAGAVSWSGGLPAAYQPLTPAGSTAVMALHGGPTDAYCGTGNPVGQCYPFQPPSEELAQDVSTAGGFAFVCDHQSGHSTSMGNYGAYFMRDSNTAGHLWAGYPFGYPGSGSDWMLNHYCYAAGTPSPWAE